MENQEPEAAPTCDQGYLIALPIINKIIKPYPQELPMFILRLASEIDYSQEEACFQGVASEISHYYAKFVDFKSHQIELHEGIRDEQTKKVFEDLKFSYEHELFPEMKTHFAVRKRFADEHDLAFTLVTCTENLYKVFERC